MSDYSECVRCGEETTREVSGMDEFGRWEEWYVCEDFPFCAPPKPVVAYAGPPDDDINF